MIMRKNQIITIVSLLGLCFVYAFSFFYLACDLPQFGFYIVLMGGIFLTAIFVFFIGKKYCTDMTSLIFIPILITCFQNVILGMEINVIDKKQLLFFIVTNVVYAWILVFLGLLFLSKDYMVKKVTICLALIAIYSLLLLIFFPVDIITFASSFRNISSPFIFFLLGAVFAKKCDTDYFTKILIVVFTFVFIVGLYEYFIDSNFWIKLNIGELWNKKGIFIDKFTGKPYNHLSAEIIGGKQLPRLVSTFAEPVNLGSFSMFCGLIFWWKKKYVYFTMALVTSVLTVSKGALVGYIVLFLVAFLIKMNDESKMFFLPIIMGGLIIALIYMVNFSASAAIHFSGFINAFQNIDKYILGIGVGNAGVYANLYNSTMKSTIQESGLGVILVQIGIPGIICYTYLLIVILKKINKLKVKRGKIMLYTMIISVYALFTFSESGIGPNTCSYFMIFIGLCIGNCKLNNFINAPITNHCI